MYGDFMKKLSFLCFVSKARLFAFVFIIVIAVASERVLAQCNPICPPGWTCSVRSYTFIPTPPSTDPTCTWQVTMCYKCGITGADPSNFKVLEIKPVPPGNGCVAPDQDWLISQIRGEFGRLCSTQPCTTGTTLVMEIPSCIKWRALGWKDEFDAYHYIKYQVSCPLSEGYCLITQTICRREDGTLQVSNLTKQAFDVTCQTTPIPEPPIIIDFEGEQNISDCFRVPNYSCF